MSKIRLIALSVFLVMFGCVPSLHEFYTDQTLVFDPALAGSWQQQDKQSPEGLWVFVPDAEKKSYGLTIYEKDGKQSKLTAHLVELDGKRFFDFYPDEQTELNAGDWLRAHLVAAHLFLRVELAKQTLTVWPMNVEVVDKLLKEQPNLVKHEWVKDRVVLTDTPQKLQAFVKAGLNIEQFFGEPITLRRLEPTPKPIDAEQ